MIMKLLLKEQSDLYIEKMVIIIQRKSKKVKTIYKSGTVLKAKSFYVVSCQDGGQNKSSKVKRIITVDVRHFETYRHFSIVINKDHSLLGAFSRILFSIYLLSKWFFSNFDELSKISIVKPCDKNATLPARDMSTRKTKSLQLVSAIYI